MNINRKWRLALALAIAVCALAVGGAQARAAAPASIELGAEAVATLRSIKTIEKDFHTIDCTIEYALDELLEKGVENSKALERFISEKLMDGLPFNFQPIHLACSTFVAAMPGGDRIQGRNMDLSYANNFLVHTKPKNGYESLSMTSGHLLGYTDSFPDGMLGRLWMLSAPYFPIDGINEKGLSVAILLIQDGIVNQMTGKPPITTTLAIRMMLDKAATVDEAIALMGKHDMRSIANTSFHFHVHDAAGDSAVIEYVDDRISVIRPSGYGQVATNFYLTPEKWEVLSDGKDRLETLQNALDASKGVVGKDKAWQMLESVKAVHDYDELTGIDFMTAYSIIFNNTKRSLDICIDAKFGKVYHYEVGSGWGEK